MWRGILSVMVRLLPNGRIMVLANPIAINLPRSRLMMHQVVTLLRMP